MRRVARCAALLCLSWATFAAAQTAAQPGFRQITVDAGKRIGQIRSFQGLNGAPLPVMPGLPDSLVEQYRQLHVDQVRTHDLMGPSEIDSRYDFHSPELAWLIPDPWERAAVVRAGNASTIFPDWNADPNAPASYNFGPTDKVIAAIRESGAEVYYRIGRSWGANVDPPADDAKFAAIVQHIVMHYNLGWANGFHDSIRYWEFWNEPEGFWSGTPEQFYSLYEQTARAIKSADPSARVGGDARASAHDDGPWREGFLDYCAAHKVPLDFFSWHWYGQDPYDVVRLGKEIRAVLDAHGFPRAESILSEWNLSADFTIRFAAELQSANNAAFAADVLTFLQDAHIDHAHFYRGDSAWMGLFDLNGQLFKPAYAFEAMAKMLSTPNRLLISGTDNIGYAGLAGISDDGQTIQILLSNYVRPDNTRLHHYGLPPELVAPGTKSLWARRTANPLPPRTGIRYADNAGYTLTLDHLPWGARKFSLKRYRISATQSLDLVEDSTLSGSAVTLAHDLPVNTVDLVVLHQQP